MVPRIEWTRRALNDLREIHAFIARDSKRYAQIQVERIRIAVAKLASFPLMGRRLPEFPNLPYREILTGDYRILYRFEEQGSRVLVMAALHGSRLLNRGSVSSG